MRYTVFPLPLGLSVTIYARVYNRALVRRLYYLNRSDLPLYLLFPVRQDFASFCMLEPLIRQSADWTNEPLAYN